MRVRVQMWGNSLAIRIPKPFAGDLGLAADGEVALTLARGRLVVTPVKQATYRLSAMLTQVRPKNVHREQARGDAVGREVW